MPENHRSPGADVVHQPPAVFADKPRAFRFAYEQWVAADRARGEADPTLLRELAACIRGDKAPDYGADHDLAVQRTLLAGCGIADGNAMRKDPPS